MSSSSRVRNGLSEEASRARAREWFWSVHSKSTYECPDCDRGVHRAKQFDVHHKDGDPFNNGPENLVGLCRRCHCWRHGDGPTVKGLDIREWKEAFLSLGGESQ